MNCLSRTQEASVRTDDPKEPLRIKTTPKCSKRQLKTLTRIQVCSMDYCQHHAGLSLQLKQLHRPH
eukprot:GSChrysophyteH1.ASY1.ANO1.1110.1 assembled CDS